MIECLGGRPTNRCRRSAPPAAERRGVDQALRHPVQALFDELPDVGPYPEGVVPVGQRLPGLGFFPGGYGLWGMNAGRPPPAPIGGVLVLGHNFDSVRGFDRSIQRGGESPYSPTWRGIRALLSAAFRSDDWQRKCFFTNFFMGLIEGATSVGAFPGARDDPFVRRCGDFFLKQVRTLRPRVVIVLGIRTPRLLARTETCLSDWSEVSSFAALDTRDVAWLTRVRIDGAPVEFVAVTHPSLRAANVGRRRYRGHEGQEAEVMMLRDALVTAGVMGAV